MRIRTQLLALPATLLVALVVALLAVLLAAPLPGASAGEPGDWTKITTGSVANIAEPGLYRTPDGVLHVAYLSQNLSDEDLAFTTISPTGTTTATGDVLTGWESLPQDPKLVGTADGGIRAVFGGLQDTDVSNPFSSGQMFSATSDATGSAWTLQSAPLSDSGYGYASSGTGATTLADGTPVVAFTLGDELVWNVGGAPTDSTYDFGDCCVYYASLARTGDEVWAAFSANGDDADHAGVFVKQLLPAVGETVKAPRSTQDGDFVMTSQATPLVARGDDLFAAYCLGYPTCRSVGLWRLGTAAPVSVPGSAGAQEYAVSVGPGGRIWVAWAEGNTNRVRVTHTGTDDLHFGAVTTIAPPKGATIYGIAVDASEGSADVIVGDGASMFHQQVLPGLSLGAAPASWKKNLKKQVTFTVRDAGDPVGGAKVTAAGESCTTKANGSCAITFPPSGKRKITATARHAGYGAGKVVLRVG